MANIIARLGVVLGLNSAEFVQGIDRASKKLDDFSAAAGRAAMVAATALTAASLAALKYADEIVDTAKANDMAVDSIVKLSDALALSGGKSEDAGKLLASFTNFVDKAATGSFEAQKVFAKLGISLKDLGELSSTELFEKTIQGLVEIEDPITRNAKAMDILGKAVKGVDMTELHSQMQLSKTLADEQARAIENAAEVYDMITKAGRQFMLMLSTQLGPPLKATIEYFKELKSTGMDIAPVFKTFFEGIAIGAANVSFVVKTLLQDFAAMGRAAAAIFTGNFDEAKQIYREAVSRAERDRAALDQFQRRIGSPTGTGDGRRGMDDPRIIGNLPSASGVVRRLVKPGDVEAERRRKEAEREAHRLLMFVLQKQEESRLLMERQNREMAEYLDRLQKADLFLRRMQNDESARLNLDKQILEIDRNRLRLLPEEVEFERTKLELQEQHRLNLRAINEAEISKEEKALALQRETENHYKRLENAQKKMLDAFDRRQGTFEDGFMGRMYDFLRDMPTQLEYGAKAFEAVMSSMESAINNFVRTGKLSFKDLARSIIQDLLAIHIKAQLLQIFKLFRGGSAAKFDNLEGYADGGRPAINEISVVGERGPELFIPDRAGTIIPNHQLSSAIGGTTNVTNNYIQAIDVQSFEQRLLGSSNTIWAANQYAQKSLATGRGRT